MISVKSKVETIVHNRSGKKAIIKLVMNLLNLEGDMYRIDISDFSETITMYPNSENVPTPFLQTNFIENNVRYIPKEIVDGLFQSIQIPIELTDNYSEKDRLIKQQAFLIYIQNDFIDETNTKTIYNLLPTDWEIF